MHRLFVALRPPPAIRRQLLDMMGGVRGARWQSDDQIHLTLRFIGEIERHRAEDVAAALRRVTFPRPTIALAGTGTFDRKGVVHTLWAEVDADDALQALRIRIDRALVAAGIAPEGRALHPHITLARLAKGAGPIEPFLARTAGLASPPVTIDTFILYESVLGRDGATYLAVERYPLG
jgi:2'-5' RNA ligase